MAATPSMLIVAATEQELCGREGLVCGIGPVEAAAVTARALASQAPAGVVHVGIAGGSGLEPLSVVVGIEATYGDLAAAIPVLSRVAPDDGLLALARAVLPESKALPIITSAVVGRDRGTPAVEAMEGFGVLRACALAGIPAVEIRVISNEIGESDRSRWQVAEALEVLSGVLEALAATSPMGS